MKARLSLILSALQRLRLTAERVVLRGRPRVLSTACWAFPIYSQTFVYQELTQLIRRGFAVRFLYGHLDSTAPLARQFRPLWRARRRVIFHPAVCEASYRYFVRRMPDRVDRLFDTLSRESGLSPDAVRSHYHVRQAFAFARLVDAYRPAYIHSYFFYEGTLFALVASELLDVPRGVSCYADHVLDDYALKMVALHLRQCQVVVATSRRIKDELLRIEPAASAARILVKPNAINTTHFPIVSRADPGPGERFRLISVCRLEPKKGLIDLVDAVGRLRDRRVPVELHLLGGVDDSDASRAYAVALRERIQTLGLDDAVSLAGRRSEAEINEYFRTSHVFVAPFVETDTGDKDGVPTSLLEAMSAGLPIVATDAGSIVEVVEDGQDGVIVPQRDPSALADAIAALAHDAARRTVLGQNAARKIRLSFDVTTCERVFHDRLTDLLAGVPSMDVEHPTLTA